MTNETRGTTGAPSPSIEEKKLVLDHVRPTVVVRRRIYEPNAKPAEPEEDVENGPPSSVNVARALASLRADELARLEEIVRKDEQIDEEAAPSSEAVDSEAVSLVPPIDTLPVPERPAPPRQILALGREITVVELARRMSLSREEVVTSLVTNGFFSITPKSTLPRETAKVAARIFGWDVQEVDEPELEPVSHERQKSKAKPAKKKAAR